MEGVDHGLRRRSGNIDCDGVDCCASKGTSTSRDGGDKNYPTHATLTLFVQMRVNLKLRVIISLSMPSLCLNFTLHS